jgi:hypothetical protein
LKVFTDILNFKKWGIIHLNPIDGLIFFLTLKTWSCGPGQR